MRLLSQLELGEVFQVAGNPLDKYRLVLLNSCRARVVKLSPSSRIDGDHAGDFQNLACGTEITQHKTDEDEDEDEMRRRNAKGKPPAPTLLKELDPKTMQGKIIAFIMTMSHNVNDVCDHFFIERHALLTQLNVIARTSGIGYSVTGDDIRLVMPPNVDDPFEL